MGGIITQDFHKSILFIILDVSLSKLPYWKPLIHTYLGWHCSYHGSLIDAVKTHDSDVKLNPGSLACPEE